MRRLLRFRVLATATVLVVVVYAVYSWVFSDKLIASPFKPFGAVDVATFGLPLPANLKIPGDGVTLAGWFFANPRKQRRAVIMLHGFGGGRAEVLAPTPIFWDRGCDRRKHLFQCPLNRSLQQPSCRGSQRLTSRAPSEGRAAHI